MSGNYIFDVGKSMSETTVKIDDKGRVMIPKKSERQPKSRREHTSTSKQKTQP